MQKVTTRSPEETQELAKKIISFFSTQEGVRGTATIIALQGDLGAGKTVFTKGVASFLGLEDIITSPTFVIQKMYVLPEGAPWRKLIHIDAYRLESEEELSTIGWNRLATDPNNLVVIEWPEQVVLGVPSRALWLEFETVDDTTRIIHIPEVFQVEV